MGKRPRLRRPGRWPTVAIRLGEGQRARRRPTGCPPSSLSELCLGVIVVLGFVADQTAEGIVVEFRSLRNSSPAGAVRRASATKAALGAAHAGVYRDGRRGVLIRDMDRLRSTRTASSNGPLAARSAAPFEAATASKDARLQRQPPWARRPRRGTVPAPTRTTNLLATGNPPPDPSEEQAMSPYSHYEIARARQQEIVSRALNSHYSHATRTTVSGHRSVKHRLVQAAAALGAFVAAASAVTVSEAHSSRLHKAPGQPYFGTAACTGDSRVRGQGLRADLVHRARDADAQPQHRSVGNSHLVAAARSPRAGAAGPKARARPHRQFPVLPFRTHLAIGPMQSQGRGAFEHPARVVLRSRALVAVRR